MKNVLVTGASGFIGSRLVDRLSGEGCRVKAMVRSSLEKIQWPPGVELVLGDIRDPMTIKAAAVGVDFIFHLAGRAHALSESRAEEALYRAVNVDGTKHVLEAAMEVGCESVLFFSSVKAMGEQTLKCLDESAPPCPATPYGRSKLEAERLVFEYGVRNGLHVACLRLPLVYGPGNKGNLFRMISAIDRGFFPSIPEVGNRRSIVHVSNVVEAALLAATCQAANGKCYIVTDARSYTTRELYERICHGLGKRVPRWHFPVGALKLLARVGDAVGCIRGRPFLFDSDALEKLIGSACYSTDKISCELGYSPSVTFEDSLPELIAGYRNSKA